MSTEQKVEIWKSPKGYEGRYEVSTFGGVRSLLSARGSAWSNGPLTMKFKPHKGGYRKVALRKLDHYVHRLVLLTFVGECPDGYQCAHLDGNPKNNNVENLKWVTPLVNISHRTGHGTTLSLDSHPSSILNTKSVLLIRELCLAGVKQSEIASMYGVTQSCISLANSGKNWGGVL